MVAGCYCILMSNCFLQPRKFKKSISIAALVLGLSIFLPAIAFSSQAYASKISRRPTLLKVGSVPEVSKGLHKTGVLNSGDKLSVDIFLKPRNISTMRTLLSSVYNPSSPDYHHFLKQGQFSREFGPSPSIYTGVVNYLKSKGITNITLEKGNLAVSFKAGAGQISKVFDTSFMGYKLSDGKNVYANTKAPLLPQAIANDTLGVAGFNNMAVMASNEVKGKPISHLGLGKNPFTHLIIRHSNNLVSAPQSISPRVFPAAASSGSKSSVTVNTVSGNSCETSAQSQVFAAGLGGAAWTYPQLADYYGLSSVYAGGGEGSGVNIGLVELQNDYENQIQNAWQCFSGTSTPAPVSYVGVNGGQGLGSSGTTAGGAGGEATLDIEVAMALAPKSHIVVYQGNSDLFSEYYNILSDIVQSDNVQVISDSFTLCEYGISTVDTGSFAAESTLLQQAALQGQTFLVASGDTGSSACADSNASYTQLGVNDPASQPYATGVGGTSLGCGAYNSGILHPNSGFLDSAASCVNSSGSSGMFPVQTAWNDAQESGFSYPAVNSGQNSGVAPFASGGGVSSEFQMPNYQYKARTSIPGIIENGYSSSSICGSSSGTYCREVPDVSANADPLFGYLVYYQNKWNAYGGTSTATPLWAAYIADTDSLQACNNNPVGFINPTLYQLAASSPDRYLSPVTTENSIWGGNVINNAYSPANSGYYPALNQSYDMITGLGSPTGALAGALCSAPRTQAPATTTTTTVAPATTSTTTTSAPTTTAPTTTSSSSGTTSATCSVTLKVTSQWEISNGSGGFTANVTVTNNTSSVLNNWSIGWTWPSGQTIVNSWNAEISQNGSSVTAKNAIIDVTGSAPIEVGLPISPGSPEVFGLEGTWSGSNNVPTSFTLNGQPCSVAIT